MKVYARVQGFTYLNAKYAYKYRNTSCVIQKA